MKKLFSLTVLSGLLVLLASCGGGGGSSSASEAGSVFESPVFSITSKTFLRGQQLEITNPNSTGMLYVTTDGTTPSTSSALSASQQISIALNNDMAVTAVVMDGSRSSAFITHNYTVVDDSDESYIASLPDANYNYAEAFGVIGDRDYFSFDVSANKKYIVDTCDDNGTVMDSILYLYDRMTLSSVTGNDVFEGTAFDGKASQLVFKSSAADTYYIKHEEETNQQIDDYLIRILTPETLASLIIPGDMSGVLSGYQVSLNKCNRDFFSFYATAGTAYTLFTYNPTDIDTSIVLYKYAFDGLVDMDDNTSVDAVDCPNCSSITFTPTTTGLYYFMVKGADDTQTGLYEVYVGY